jgi:hypothetical protein
LPTRKNLRNRGDQQKPYLVLLFVVFYFLYGREAQHPIYGHLQHLRKKMLSFCCRKSYFCTHTHTQNTHTCSEREKRERERSVKMNERDQAVQGKPTEGDDVSIQLTSTLR